MQNANKVQSALKWIGLAFLASIFTPPQSWSRGIWRFVFVIAPHTFRDATYREAARGLHEASAIQMMYYAIPCSILLLFLVIVLSSENEKYSGSPEPVVHPKKQLTQRAWGGVVLIFLICVQLINYVELAEANIAYTYFAQSMTICRPYMNEREAQMLESRFAAINGKDDYLNIVSSLQRLAGSNQRALPVFFPW